MSRKRHYPPSYVKYQLNNPSITVHLTKKVKSNLDAIKGERSYADIISEILNNTFDLEKEIQKLPVTEAVVKYMNGFDEARDRYAHTGICRKCGRDYFLQKDGLCELCHKDQVLYPNFTKFKNKKSTIALNEETFEKLKIKLPQNERMIFENGRKKGYSEGEDDAWERAEEEFKITYPCSRCGKSMQMKPGEKDHIAMVQYMKEHGWHHHEC